MKRFFSFFIFLACAFPVFPQVKEFIPFQVYEPAYIDADSMLKYEGKLARWEKGWMYTKDVSGKNRPWKKARKLDSGEFLVRIYKGAEAALHKIPAVKNISINKSGTYAAFTAAFGGSPVSSAGVIDLKNNLLLFTLDLKQKAKGAKGPPQLAMEHSWFSPGISEDGKYLACDGFKGTGERESAIINISDRKTEVLTGAAMPAISGDRVFFLEQDSAKKTYYLKFRPIAGGKPVTAGSFKGRAVGLETLDSGIYVITDSRVFSCDRVSGSGFKEIHDYSYLNKGYEFISAEKTFSGRINNRDYIFLAMKRVKNGNYEWTLFGLEVE